MTKEEMKAIDNLIEYVKKDEIYNGTRENLSDFDKFCIDHCTDIVNVLELIKKQQSELEKKDKMIELIKEEIRDHIGLKNRLKRDEREPDMFNQGRFYVANNVNNILKGK